MNGYTLMMKMLETGHWVPVKGVASVALFVNNEAGHPRPFIAAGEKGQLGFPRTCFEQSRDFYEVLDEQEEALGACLNKVEG